jgi:hypothetical protein
MVKETVVQYVGHNWKKATKSQIVALANRLGDGEKLTVGICPSNIRMFNSWGMYTYFKLDNTLKTIHPNHESTLDVFVNTFKYYNCNDETGKYVHFYYVYSE